MGVGSCLRVLNAFRHQRNKQLRGEVASMGTLLVLNAFRHQRNKQRKLLNIFPIGEKCSTPFGINGTNSRSSWLATFPPSMCSTPFSINGTNSRCALLLVLLLLCAQRLSASTEQTAKLPTYRRTDRYQVLNAFRHQRNKQEQNREDRNRNSRAQRLSASTEQTADVKELRFKPPEVVLNAFRHQRNKQLVLTLNRLD